MYMYICKIQMFAAFLVVGSFLDSGKVPTHGCRSKFKRTSQSLLSQSPVQDSLTDISRELVWRLQRSPCEPLQNVCKRMWCVQVNSTKLSLAKTSSELRSDGQLLADIWRFVGVDYIIVPYKSVHACAYVCLPCVYLCVKRNSDCRGRKFCLEVWTEGDVQGSTSQAKWQHWCVEGQTLHRSLRQSGRGRREQSCEWEGQSVHVNNVQDLTKFESKASEQQELSEQDTSCHNQKSNF